MLCRCSASEGGRRKLLGFLLEEGLQSLSYEHQPNAHYWKACPYCSRTSYISIQFEDVRVEKQDDDEDAAVVPDANQVDTEEDEEKEERSYGDIHQECYEECYEHLYREFHEPVDEMDYF